jgi:hypothetical protein
LEGSKLWSLWPDTCGARLPRLRDTRAAPRLLAESELRFTLRAGDWLYIPRGWPHVAATPKAAGDAPAAAGAAVRDGGSVHLSLSVDLEPPFEMAGALHIALRLFCLQRHRDEDARGAAKRQCTEIAANSLGATEVWLHTHIDLVASAPASEALRLSAFVRRASTLGTGDEALAAAAECWAGFFDTADVLAELAARVATEGCEQRLAWLQLVVPPCGDESRQAAACPPPRAFTQLAAACAEQLRSEFLAWVGDSGSGQGRWAAVEEVALRIGVELQRGRHGLAAARAAVTPVPD